ALPVALARRTSHWKGRRCCPGPVPPLCSDATDIRAAEYNMWGPLAWHIFSAWNKRGGRLKPRLGALTRPPLMPERISPERPAVQQHRWSAIRAPPGYEVPGL